MSETSKPASKADDPSWDELKPQFIKMALELGPLIIFYLGFTFGGRIIAAFPQFAAAGFDDPLYPAEQASVRFCQILHAHPIGCKCIRLHAPCRPDRAGYRMAHPVAYSLGQKQAGTQGQGKCRHEQQTGTDDPH